MVHLVLLFRSLALHIFLIVDLFSQFLYQYFLLTFVLFLLHFLLGFLLLPPVLLVLRFFLGFLLLPPVLLVLRFLLGFPPLPLVRFVLRFLLGFLPLPLVLLVHQPLMFSRQSLLPLAPSFFHNFHLNFFLLLLLTIHQYLYWLFHFQVNF